jgi:hypothetical protein
MKIVCTFPGKFGDLLWALPTVRAISESCGEPVQLVIAKPFEAIVPLLSQQPYIHTAITLKNWHTQDTAPISPRIPPETFHADKVIHLGYEGWPTLALPFEIERIGRGQQEFGPISTEPWITVDGKKPTGVNERAVTVGFTDEWFELKYGLTSIVKYAIQPKNFQRAHSWHILVPPQGRWATEGAGAENITRDDWVRSAWWIHESRVFLGCCSAQHVLACAMGKPTVVMEPNPQRHHPIFWPAIKRIHKVVGNDGQFTFDARHVKDVLQQFL